MKAENKHAAPFARGFTLIELLVVISIIAVLASLTVAIGTVANRKGKEGRIMADFRKLETEIESYRAALGSLPPDNPGYPSTNQLFYELSGTTYDNTAFSTPGGAEVVTAVNVKAVFRADGIANSTRDVKELKFTTTFKPVQIKELAANASVKVLGVPVDGPDTFVPYPTLNAPSADPPPPVPLFLAGKNNTRINPWLYDSSTKFRNNKGPDKYDLWTEVMIGKKRIRFSNWERQPVVYDKDE